MKVLRDSLRTFMDVLCKYNAYSLRTSMDSLLKFFASPYGPSRIYYEGPLHSLNDFHG